MPSYYPCLLFHKNILELEPTLYFPKQLNIRGSNRLRVVGGELKVHFLTLQMFLRRPEMNKNKENKLK